MPDIIDEILYDTATKSRTELASGIGTIVGTNVTSVSGTSRTLTNDDHNKFLDFTSSSSITVTVPAGLRSDFCVGISQGGTGAITISAGAGTTVVTRASRTLSTTERYEVVTLAAVAANTYRVL